MNYPNGPWKNLFSGIFDEYSLRILINQDGYVITEILNSDKTKAIVNLSVILNLNGDAESFIETMPKSGNFIMIHNEKSTSKFLFLTQTSELINVDDGQAKDLCLKQISALEKNIKIIKDVASSYDLKINSYQSIDDNIKKMLFTNPVVFSTLISEPKLIEKIITPKETPKPKGNSINFGFHKSTTELSYEPIEYFDKTLIIYNKSEDVKDKIIKIASEEMSLNDTNVLIFSYDNNFEQIKFPNENLSIVREKLNTEPIGFPVTVFDVSKNGIYCDLTEIPANALNELYDVGIHNSSNIIKNIIESKKPRAIDEVYDLIGEMIPDDKYTKYDILLAQRIINIIKQMHPELYLGQQSVDPFTKEWKKMGKVNVVTLNKKDNIANKVVIHNIIKKLSRDLNKIAICIPMANEILPRDNLDTITTELKDIIKNIKNKYIFLCTPNEIDINKEITETYQTEIQITGDSDCALKIKEARPYRIDLRPTLSK